MEMTRRENDKRVRSLYVEMKDMIHVLIQSVDFHVSVLSMLMAITVFGTLRIRRIRGLMESL